MIRYTTEGQEGNNTVFELDEDTIVVWITQGNDKLYIEDFGEFEKQIEKFKRMIAVARE